MRKIQSCCLCIPVNIGTYILGFSQILGLVEQFKAFNLFVAITQGLVGAFFLMMWVNDNEQSRLWFFYAFTFGALVMPLLFLSGAITEGNAFSIESISAKACKSMTEEQLK